MKKIYSLRKCRHILRQAYHLFCRKKKKLSAEQTTTLKDTLLSLQQAILGKKPEEASHLAKQVQQLCSLHMRKSGLEQLKDFVLTFGVALIVAVLVRQMWFEFYEIPSGSMRPTFKEQDRLCVSKTSFGINIPLKPQEFYFDPDLVQRNGIVIFTGENMDIRDVDTLYFYLFPGKKQYVKRLIGKPGDILYFYGGQIFGIDREGKDISAELQVPSLANIDHIPFIDFERKVVFPPYPVRGVYAPVFLYQMNTPVAKLSVSANNAIHGEMLGMQGVHDSQAPAVKTYGDLWGFHNFATARLTTQTTEGAAPLYLELRHNPSFAGAKLIQDEMGRVRPTLGYSISLIPLQEQEMRTLFANLYTARFVVKAGKAYRYGASETHIDNEITLIKLPHVPNGCYEFIDGKAYEIVWQGITKELPPTHPLYEFTPSNLQLLFNVGMEWDARFLGADKRWHLTPARYAYFREGTLYVMGKPFLSPDSATLQELLQSNTPFIDKGPPLTSEGTLDVAFIQQNGLLIPEGQYLALGDNHAMSADSREFGFVPASNLRGAPNIIFWPPGERWGHPNQPSYPLFNLPRSVVWVLAGISITGATIYWRRRNTLPLRF